MMEILKGKIIVSIFAVAILVFSTLTVTAMGIDEREKTKVLVEVGNEQNVEYIKENTEILVDYENGRYLVEVPERRAEDIKRISDREGIDDSRYDIYLDTIRESFDRREGTPDLPAEYSEKTGAYIVQFVGPAKSMEWKEQISETGASVEREVANYALLVRMDQETKSQVKELDIVEWVGPYYSGYKVSDDLIGSEEEKELVKITGWDQEADNEIGEKLKKMGIDIERETSTGPIVNVDPLRIPDIAGLEEVRRIDPYSYPETKDNAANEIHEIQSGWYPSWSGLPVELTGEGEVVGIQDTGFDEGEIYNGDDGNPDFFKGSGGDRVIRYTDQTGSSDPDGQNSGVAHGTHVAGIVGGNEYNWKNHMGLDPSTREWHHGEAAGVAPEVEFSLDGCTSSFGGLSTSHGYWDGQESDGARVFQNSWGAQNPADYDSNSIDVDDRMDPYSSSAMNGAPENIIMFSAGNEGPDEHTMTPRPMAKNTIAVGASQNYRPGEYHNADNPDYVADFSSRGGPSFSNGRIKPDVVTTGTAMISALARGEHEANDGQNQSSYITEVDEYDTSIPGEGSDGIPDYQYMQGTSMAGPHAAGMAVLIREYYKEMHGIQNPTNPLVKATMINGAERMDPDLYEYPGYAQGWGRPNLRKSLFPSAPRSNQFAEGTFDQTGTWDAAADGGMNLEIASNDEPFKATLNWLDSSGMEMNRQLHMYAESPNGNTYYSGVDNYDQNGWTTPGSSTIDTVNTVQRIEIKDPEPGTWTLTVQADSIPSNADFALVTSADFGPQDDYNVDLTTDYPTTQSLASGGTTHLPVEITNWGTNPDTIEVSDSSPADLTVSYSPQSSFSLESTEKANTDVMITANTGLAEQVIEFEITAVSQDDPSSPSASDTIQMTIQILTEPLPERKKLAESDADEMFPEIITFADSGGTNWIFAAYQMVTPDGKQVRVKYSELDTNGEPIQWQGPFNPMSTNPTVDPNYVQLQHIDSGTYQDRVVVYWNGQTPGSGGDEYEAKAAWADTGAYDTWNGPVQIDNNYGTDTVNMKRGSYMLFRDDGTADGELTYVFEHLDMDSSGKASNIGIAYVTSSDGGETWNSANDVPGADGSSGYFYFFPNGVTDQNDVNWHFFYYRDSSGNQRMVVTMLQDNDGWSSEVKVAGDLTGDPVDNHQFPMAAHYNNSGTNEVYMSCIYDNAGDFNDLTTSYVTGDYSSTNPPAESDFTSYDNVAGKAVSQEDMSGADILGKTAGNDGWIWTSYLETDTPFDVPNINVARSNDKYSSVTVDYVTRDNYRKLNPNMASQTIDGTSYAYVAYHSSQGTTRDVDHEVFLSILHSDWKSEPDTQGPDTSHVSSNPNPVNMSTDNNFNLTASIDDTMTGRSGIQTAEYVETDTTVTDPSTIDWSQASGMTISGSSSTEIAEAESLTVPDHWATGGTYRYWVRGQDSAGNWGTESADHIDIEVTGETVQETYNLTVNSTAGGSVSTPGEDTFEYTSGKVVDLEARPDEGYYFVEWTGDNNTIGDTTSNQTTITMNDNYSITAEFTDINYTLTIDSTVGGNVTTPGEDTFEYGAGQVVDLEARPDEGYYFVEWTGDNNTIGDTTSNQTTITMNDNYSIMANFGTTDVSNVLIYPDTDQLIEAGKELEFDAEAYDGSGNLITDNPEDFNWQNADIGVFYETVAGDYDVTATYQGVTSSVVTVTVEPADAEDIEVSPQTASITAGATQGYTATAYDKWDNGFDVTGGTTWSDNVEPTDRSSWTDNVTTVEEAGEWNITGEYENATGVIFTDNASLTVEPGAVDTVSIYPEADQVVYAGEELLFDAEAKDTYGNLITDNVDDFGWENATQGVFYETTAGDYNVTATYDGMTSPITTVTVISYTLTIDSTGGGNVAVPGEGTFSYIPGEVVDLEAIPDDGYHFVNWTGDTGTIVDKESNQTSIEMQDNYSITAEFAETDYTLTIDSTGGGNVAVPGEGTFGYQDGEIVNLEAVADPDYHFVEWTGDTGTIGSTESNQTDIEMLDNYSITAGFEITTYNLTVSSTDGGSVSEPGEDTFEYNSGEIVDLEAVAAQDYYFVEWTGDNETIDDTTANQTTIRIEGEYSITADFDTTNVAEVLIYPDTDQTIEAGKELQFNAEAYDQDDELITDDVAAFDWENATAGVFSRGTVGDYEVTATYEGLTSDPTTVIVEPSEAESIEIEPNEVSILPGNSISYTATAYDTYNNDFEVTGEVDWSIEAGAGGSWNENTYTSENEGNWTVNGTYTSNGTTLTDEALLTVEAADIDHIEISPQESNLTAGSSQEYTATAYDVENSEYEITGDTVWSIESGAGGSWNDNVYTSENVGEWTVTGTYTYEGEDFTDEATLTVESEQPEEYTLTINIEGEGTTEPSEGMHNYQEGEEVNITAMAGEGWYFVEWTGDYEGTENEIAVTMNSDKNVTAHFGEESSVVKYELTINSAEGGEVVVPGERTFEYNSSEVVDLEALADEGYEFSEWIGDVENIDDTGANETTITMEGNYTITAEFEEVGTEYELVINAEEGGSTDPTPDTYTHPMGEEVTIEAVPDLDWQFSHWVGDYPEDGEEDPEITITLDSDKEVTAHFEEEPASAYFSVEITNYEDEVKKGEEVSLEYKVTNTGGVEDTQQIVFYVDGVSVDSVALTLGPGEEKQDKFTWEPQAEGEYELEVASDDDQSDAVQVTTLADDDGAGGVMSVLCGYWWLILILIIAAIIVLVLVLLRREKDEGPADEQMEGLYEEPPPPSDEGEQTFDQGPQEEEFTEEPTEDYSEDYGEVGPEEKPYEEQFVEEEEPVDQEVLDEELDEEFKERFGEEE